MPSAPGRCFGQRCGDPAAGVGGVDLFVDDADLDGVVHTTGDPLVLGGKLLVQRLTLVILGAAASFFLCRMPTAALAPITATSASGQANTLVAPNEREFIAM